MTKYDGTNDKGNDGGDSGAFRGRRHPFLDRRLDWKKVEKRMRGSDASGSDASDRVAVPLEVPAFQLVNEPNPRYQRVEACVAAVKQLSTNFDKWNTIRDCLIKEYQSAGPDPRDSEKALASFIGSVNQRLGKAGQINVEPLTGEFAEQAAAAENVIHPELTLNVRVYHSGGLLGPIGVCFKNNV